jgi:glycosyltransferase 2 family protein
MFNPVGTRQRGLTSTARWIYWLIQLVIVAGLIYYFRKIGVYAVRAELAALNLHPLLAGIAIVVGTNLLRPLRIFIFLRDMGLSLRWWHLFRWSQEGWFLSLLTPMKVGIFYTAYRIEAVHRARGAGVIALVLDRWTDLIIILVMGLFAIGFHPEEAIGGLRGTTFVILIGILLISFILVIVSQQRSLSQGVLRCFPTNRLAGRAGPILQEIRNAFRAMNASMLVKFCLISLAIWTAYITGFYFLFAAAGVDLGFSSTVACICLVMLAQSLPFTMLGFGTREAALVFYLGIYGFHPSAALSVSFLFVVVLALSLLISSIFWFLRHR